MKKLTQLRAIPALMLALMGAAGGLTLEGQTVLLGTYNGTTITGDVSIAASTSAIFTGGANFTGTNATFGNYSTFNWNQNGTLTGKAVTLGSATTYGQIAVGTNNSLTLGPGTTVTGGVYLDGGAGASITNQGTITQNSSYTGYIYAPTVVNQGGITVNAGQSLYFGYTSGESITNAVGGTLTANGANATLYTYNVSNQGTITAQNGGVVEFIGAALTSAGLGNSQIGTGGGHLYLNGTVDNTAATLNAPTGGSYELYGGTINNGTIAAGALAFTSSGGTLNNVSYTGNLGLAASTSATFTGGTTFTGTSATIGSYAALNWNQNGTLTGTTIALGSTGTYGQIAVGTNNSLTLGPGTTVTGGVYLDGTTGASITNQGTITQTSTSTGYFYGPTVVNQGSITVNAGTNFYFGYTNGESVTNAVGGTLTANGAGATLYGFNVSNQGTITAQNGGVVEFTGTALTTAGLGNSQIGTGGGHLYLNGTVDNTAATLNAPTGGSYELYGGTINNGTIAAGALTFTSYGGTLSNVSYTGNFGLAASTSATFTGGTTFTGTNATFGDYSTLNWFQNGTLTGKTVTLGTAGTYGQIAVGTNNSLTLGPGTTVTGGLYLDGTTGASFTNQGTITQTSTAAGFIYAPTVVNQGSITVNAGTSLYFGYSSGESITNAVGGTLTANGASATLYGFNVSNQGTITAQNGGVVEFTGTALTTAGLGNSQIGTGGGHLYLNGTVDNTAATLNAPTGGSYELYGGTINNGTIAAGALAFTNYGGTLSNVSYTGNFGLAASTAATFTGGTTFTGTNATFGDYATLNWNQNGTLVGKTVTLGSASTYGQIAVGTNNTLTFDPTTTVTGGVYLDGTTGASIINQGTITQSSTSTGYIYGPTVVNQGGITVNAGTSLFFGYSSGESITNAVGGTLTANGAGATLYAVNVSNQGTITAQNGGVVEFTGTALTSAGLGNSQIGTGGGHLYINGTVDNTAATLVAPTSGSYELYGGTINNGTIAAGALTFTSSNGTLSNVTYTGNLTTPTSTYVTFTNGTSFTGSAAALGDYSYLYWNQNGTLAGKTITLGTGTAYGIIDVGGSNTLTLDSATSLTGDIYLYGNTGSSITNQGAISQTYGTGYLYGPTLVNQGSVTVGANSTLYFGYNSGESTTNAVGGTITANGAVANIYLHNLINQGTLSVQIGGEILFTCATTTANLGTVVIGTGGGHAYLEGTLDNTGATLSAPTGGSYSLYGGTINNGTIAPNTISLTSSGGTLSNVVLTGNSNIPANTSVTVTNGTSFTGPTLNIGNSGYLYWNQNGTIAGKALTLGLGGAYGVIDVGTNNAITFDSATTLTGNMYVYGNTGAAITNQGAISQTLGSGYLYAPTLINQGSITVGTGANLYLGNASAGYNFSNTATGTIAVTGGIANLQSVLTNAGIINVQSGTVAANNTLTNGPTGTIMGAGSISGNLAVAGGFLSPGNSGIGALTFFNGGFTVTSPTVYNLDMGGTTSDELIFQNPTGAVALGSGLLIPTINLLSAPAPYTTFNIAVISSGGSGFTGYLYNLPANGSGIAASFGGVPYDFTVTYLANSISFTSVPEPGTVGLLSGGLAMLTLNWWRRRRNRA